MRRVYGDFEFHLCSEEELPQPIVMPAPVAAPAPEPEPEPENVWAPIPAPVVAPEPVAAPREAHQSEFNLDMSFGSAEDEVPADSMDRVADMFGDDDELERMMASHSAAPARPAGKLNVFPKKADVEAEEALSARIRSMFEDEPEEDSFKPQAAPRSIPRHSSLGYNDMRDIFPGG